MGQATLTKFRFSPRGDSHVTCSVGGIVRAVDSASSAMEQRAPSALVLSALQLSGLEMSGLVQLI